MTLGLDFYPYSGKDFVLYKRPHCTRLKEWEALCLLFVDKVEEWKE